MAHRPAHRPTRRSMAEQPIRRIPIVTRLGAVTIAFGLLFDLSEHSFAAAGPSGFTPGEHAAHLVVLIGMVLALAGIVADGVRHAGRPPRPERSPRHALR